MFKFLKEKLKSAISRISETVEKGAKAEEKTEEIPAEELPKEEESFFTKLKRRIVGRKEEKEIISEIEPIVEDLVEQKEADEIPEQKDEAKFHQKKEHKKSTNLEFIGRASEIKDSIKKIGEKPRHKTEVKPAQPIEKISTIKKPVEEAPIEKAHEKQGFFSAIKEKITTTKINGEQFESLFWEMEMALMENNVAVEVIEKIKDDLKKELVETPIKRTRIEETISFALKNSIEGLFENPNLDLIHEIKSSKEKPYIIAFFGINGSGKTTSIAKIASMLKDRKISCVLAASDTFRAASIEQLQLHADKIGVTLIKHTYGSDPAAVAFDAIKHAKAKKIDAVLIDTAGRMHSNVNLIDEMKKIVRVAKPDLKIFVGESITGNDCVEQAKTFNDAVGIDGIILAKADVDEKGGAAISVSYVTKKPILYLGVGQEYGDLELFNKDRIVKNIGLA